MRGKSTGRHKRRATPRRDGRVRRARPRRSVGTGGRTGPRRRGVPGGVFGYPREAGPPSALASRPGAFLFSATTCSGRPQAPPIPNPAYGLRGTPLPRRTVTRVGEPARPLRRPARRANPRSCRPPRPPRPAPRPRPPPAAGPERRGAQLPPARADADPRRPPGPQAQLHPGRHVARVRRGRRDADDHPRVEAGDLALQLARGRGGHVRARAQDPDAGGDDAPVGAVLLAGGHQNARADRFSYPPSGKHPSQGSEGAPVARVPVGTSSRAGVPPSVAYPAPLAASRCGASPARCSSRPAPGRSGSRSSASLRAPPGSHSSSCLFCNRSTPRGPWLFVLASRGACLFRSPPGVPHHRVCYASEGPPRPSSRDRFRNLPCPPTPPSRTPRDAQANFREPPTAGGG